MHTQSQSKSTGVSNLNEVAEILATAFVRLQEKRVITANNRDYLIDLTAPPSIHADAENSTNTEA